MMQLREYIDDTEDYINIQVTKNEKSEFLKCCENVISLTGYNHCLFAVRQSSKSADSGE